MRRLGFGILVFLLAQLTLSLGAAPAPSSYHAIEKTIERVRQKWATIGGPEDPNAPGWNRLFDLLNDKLRSYSKAATATDQKAALKSIQAVSSTLDSLTWPPAIELRERLNEWLLPRLRLVEAEIQLVGAPREDAHHKFRRRACKP